MKEYWAELKSAGFWGWDIKILSREVTSIGGLPMEEQCRTAWTERRAKRLARRVIRRKYARDTRAASAKKFTIRKEDL